MKCPRCQHENPTGMKFCGECAAPLASTCPSCGAANPPENKFCGQCAAPLRTTPMAKFAAPDSYTPKHLIEKILTSKAALEGERKQVTVLFADLKGSMELLADRDPEEARKLLDPVLEHMMEAVHRYEGTVNQVMGDGIMALFGAPLAHEDHAVRACYAALRMQESVKRYTEELRRRGSTPVQIRVGLNSGEVVVRSIGSDLHMDYTAIGQTTHLAARMEQIASAGSILMTGETLKLAEGYVQVKSLGAVPVKGLEAPIDASELIAVGSVRTRFQATVARGLTRFCGRQTELEALNRALDRAGAGHGEVVALVGEPGVGKSRLVWEFTHSHRTEQWLVLESGSVSYGKATAYRPIIDLLREYCEIEDRDDERRIREKLTGKLLTLDKALENTLPAFLTLLDVPVDEPEWQALDPPQRRQRTLESCKRLVLRESRLQPLLLVFEDLHWIDTETQAFLDSLIESLPTARILLLVNYRPEYQQAWASKTYYTQLRIDPLPPDTADQLLAALMGEDPVLQGFRHFLIERTEGNPFFLEESVQTLAETHVLLGERGAYRLAAPLGEIQVPATVQAVLAARIDRLSSVEKRLLQTAAVIGKDVPFALLEAITELSSERLREGLAHLQGAEFLYETSLYPDLEYTFKHALTHDVAYSGLLQERRRGIHAAIVGAIERLYPDRLIEHVERLGYHALRGEVWDKAVPYLRQAGAKAFSRSANREAAAWFEQALSGLRHLQSGGGAAEQAIDLRFDLRNALLPLGEHERILELLREARALAEALGDQRRVGWLSAYTGIHLSFLGEHEQAVASDERALAIADALDDASLHIATNFYLGASHSFLGHYREAIDFHNRCLAAIRPDQLRERFGLAGPASVFAGNWIVACLAELGEFAEGVERAAAIIQLAEMIDQPYSLTYTYFNVGLLHLRKGDALNAIAVLERGLVVSPTFTWAWVAGYLGYGYLLAGRVDEALPLLERAVEQAAAVRLMWAQSLRLATLAEGYEIAGRIDEAARLAEQALNLARQQGERGHEAWVLRVLGEIYSHRELGSVTDASGLYHRALALATELGMRPLVAHCHLGLGKLYRVTGKQEQAREHLTTATTMYREMDMQFWLERAETETRKSC